MFVFLNASYILFCFDLLLIHTSLPPALTSGMYLLESVWFLLPTQHRPHKHKLVSSALLYFLLSQILSSATPLQCRIVLLIGGLPVNTVFNFYLFCIFIIKFYFSFSMCASRYQKFSDNLSMPHINVSSSSKLPIISLWIIVVDLCVFLILCIVDHTFCSLGIWFLSLIHFSIRLLMVDIVGLYKLGRQVTGI